MVGYWSVAFLARRGVQPVREVFVLVRCCNSSPGGLPTAMRNPLRYARLNGVIMPAEARLPVRIKSRDLPCPRVRALNASQRHHPE